jgi:peptidyl-prolyl cis-trans isomerase D
MLDLFRKRGLSSIVYGVIIVGMVMVFVIQFRPNAGQATGSLKEACVVLVKGHCVNPKSYKAAYRLLIPRDQQGNLLTARARQMHLLQVTADGIVERELLVSEAERIGVRATPDEVDAEILNGFIHVSIPSDNPYLASSLRVADGKIYAGFKDQKTKKFDYKVYERSIRMLTGKSATEFKEEQERELVAAKMRDMIRSPIRVSDAEALEMYVTEKSNAKVSYVEVKTGWLVRWAATATPGDVDTWLKDKTNQAIVDSAMTAREKESAPVKDHIRHVLAKFSPTATPEEKAVALGRIAKAYARVKAGEAFAEVARDASDDTSNAHGGDVGDKTSGFVEPFKVAADALKPGEMTNEAIESQFGYHLIYKDAPEQKDEILAKVKRGMARQLYLKHVTLELAKTLATRIRDDVKGGKTADDAVKAIIAQYTKAPEKLPPFGVRGSKGAGSKGAGSKDAGADATVAAVGDAGAAAAAVVPKGMTADTDPERPQVQTSAGFNKGGDAIEQLSNDASAEVNKFAFSSKDGDVMPEPLRVDSGYMVVQLKEHKSSSKEDFDKERETYVDTLLAPKQAEALALYVKRLRESAKADVKIDENYTKEATGRDGGAPADTEEEEQ